MGLVVYRNSKSVYDDKLLMRLQVKWQVGYIWIV